MKTQIFQQRIRAAQKSQGKSNNTIYRKCLEIIQTHKNNFGGKLLDYGAGQGKLTKEIASLGQFEEIWAVDIIKKHNNTKQPINWRFCDLNEKLDLPSKHFDFIVAIEVIEHLENPWLTAREWFRLLKENGVLIFSTPNNESFRSLLSLLFRGNFASFSNNNFPAHLNAFLKIDLERTLKLAGFTKIEFYYSNEGRVPKLNLTWQQISLDLLGGKQFSDNIFVVAKK